MQCKPMRLKRDDLHPDPTNPRQEVDKNSLLELAHSMKTQGLLVPLIVRLVAGIYWIIDGYRRRLAAELAHIEELDCLVVDRALTKGETRLLMIVSSEQRVGLSSWDLYNAYWEHLKENPSLQLKDLALLVSRQPPAITKILSLSKCCPEAIQAAEAGLITVSDWYPLSQLSSHDDQRLALAKFLGESSAHEPQQAIPEVEAAPVAEKRTRSPRVYSDQPRRSTLSIPTADGEVSMKGRFSSMVDVVGRLEELLSKARQAMEMDPKAWVKLMKEAS